MVETLWLARHGSRLDFVDPEWHKSAESPYDPPLSPDGLVQAAQLGLRLKNEKIEHIFSSPFLRCVMTADIVARQLGNSVRIEAGFSEWLNADWFSSPPAIIPLEVQARRFSTIDLTYSSQVQPAYPETGETVLKRTGEAIDAVTNEHEGAILVVGHGATVYGSLVRLLGVSMDDVARFLGELHFCCLCKLCHQAGRWRLDLAADVSHLEIRSGGDRFH